MWKSKFYGAFVLNRRVDLHAIDATPARPDSLFDFHTARDELAAERRGEVERVFRVLRPAAPTLLVRHRRGDALSAEGQRPDGRFWQIGESAISDVKNRRASHEHSYASNAPLQRALGTPNRARVPFPMDPQNDLGKVRASVM